MDKVTGRGEGGWVEGNLWRCVYSHLKDCNEGDALPQATHPHPVLHREFSVLEYD